MARRTDGEKVDALEKATASLEANLTNATSEVAKIYQKLQETQKELQLHLRAYDGEIKLLRHQIEELRKDRERGGQRIWAILTALIAGVLGALLINLLGIKK